VEIIANPAASAQTRIALTGALWVKYNIPRRMKRKAEIPVNTLRMGFEFERTRAASKTRLTRKKIHPIIGNHWGGMEEKRRVLMFGARIRLWERKNRQTAAAKTVE
jgi:hypothetical protein